MKRTTLIILLILLVGCTTQNLAGEAYNIEQYLTQGSTQNFATTNVHDFAGIGESGMILRVDHNFGKVTFSRSYNDPIVVVGPLSFAGNQPAHPRIKQITNDGFLVRSEEWYDLDGGHYAESIPYFVIERGNHTIDGKQVIAGSMNVGAQQRSIPLGGFSVPVAFASIATLNAPAPLTHRITLVNTGRMSALLQQEENKNYGTMQDETLNYVIFEQGQYGQGALVSTHAKFVDHNWKTYDWFNLKNSRQKSSPLGA